MVRPRTICTALATATLAGAPTVASASSSPIRFAYVTVGTPRSLPETTIGAGSPVVYGVLILRGRVAAGTPARFVFSRLLRRHGGTRRLPLAVSTVRLRPADRAVAVPLPRSAYATRRGAWTLGVSVGASHRGFRFRVGP